MKKLFSLVLLCLSFYCFGQLPANYNFEKYSNPDKKNELSLYFKNLIPKKLLKNVRSKNKSGNIIISFNFNSDNEIYSVKTNSYNTELSDIIINGFEDYPIENLKIDRIDSKQNYSLQIISNHKSKNIINCSSKVIVDTQPICSDCKNLDNYFDIKDCFTQEVEKHFFSNFNFNLVKNNDLKYETFVNVKFKVLENGQLVHGKSKTLSKLFLNELDRVLQTFPELETTGTINGEKRANNYSFSFHSNPKETPKLKGKYDSFNHYSKPNKNNEFSNYFSKNLSAELISKSNLNRTNNKFLLYFNLDKKNNPTNIKTNSRSTELENAIISIFKKYPSDKLPINDKSMLNYYIFQVLSYANGETSINCSSSISFERVPIYRGCENSKSKLDAKNCLNKQMQSHVAKNFNPRNIDVTNLSGKVKIYCQFKFTKTGDVTILRIRAPNQSLKIEAARVVNSIPKLKMPGMQYGKPVNVTYMLPINFHVESIKSSNRRN